MTTVWIYTDTSKQVGDPDQLKVFAGQDDADRWFRQHDPEGVRTTAASAETHWEITACGNLDRSASAQAPELFQERKGPRADP